MAIFTMWSEEGLILGCDYEPVSSGLDNDEVEKLLEAASH